MKNGEISPTPLKIKPGDTVQWVNNDLPQYKVLFIDPIPELQLPSYIVLENGGTFSITFSTQVYNNNIFRLAFQKSNGTLQDVSVIQVQSQSLASLQSPSSPAPSQSSQIIPIWVMILIILAIIVLLILFYKLYKSKSK